MPFLVLFVPVIVPEELSLLPSVAERRLRLAWSRGNLDRFRQRARALVREERRSIRVLAEALCERRHITGDEIGVLLSVTR